MVMLLGLSMFKMYTFVVQQVCTTVQDALYHRLLRLMNIYIYITDKDQHFNQILIIIITLVDVNCF